MLCGYILSQPNWTFPFGKEGRISETQALTSRFEDKTN